MTIQAGSAPNTDRFELGNVSHFDFTENTEEEWSTLRLEIVTLNDSLATYSLTMSGRYNFTQSFSREGPQYVGFMQYNADGINVSQDNFEISVIPEPGATALGIGAAALGAILLISRRRRKAE